MIIMKKYKGFTLIELLAIIVILAIIAVVTVPIILNVIQDSEKGAIKDSAYGYKDSVQKYYLTYEITNSNVSFPDGVYTIDSAGDLVYNENILEIDVSGNKPDQNSWVKLENGNVTAFSLKYDDYVATKYQNTDIQIVKGGSIRRPPSNLPSFATLTDDSDNDNSISTGDLVCIDNTSECFYVVSSDSDETVLLSQYNLNVGANPKVEETGLQDSDVKGYVTSGTTYGTVRFSIDHYWSSYAQSYPIDVYENSDSINYYVENYGDYLEENGVTLEQIRLLTYDEATSSNIGCVGDSSYSCSSAPAWIYSTSYWLGTAYNESYVWYILSNGTFGAGGYGVANEKGVRPVIKILTDYIN